MDNITEQTIIEAIIVLDADKLQEILAALKDQIYVISDKMSTTKRIINALRAANFEAQTNDYHVRFDILSQQLEEARDLYTKCYNALKNIKTS